MSKNSRQLYKITTLGVLVSVIISSCAVNSTPLLPLEGVNLPSRNINETEEKSESKNIEESPVVVSPEITRVVTKEPTSTSTAEPIQTDSVKVTPVMVPGGEDQDLVAIVKADLAARLGVSPEVISVVSAKAVVWSDSSLGCPKAGMMYTQVLTPGYQIVLQYDGNQYDYRTDQSGFIKLCRQ